MTLLKVIHVVGARPNFMKIAPIMEEMAKYPEQFQQVLVHTGQHIMTICRESFSRTWGYRRLIFTWE